MSSFRSMIHPDGTPIQQSMTADAQDYLPQQVSRMMLGVVLAVHPADSKNNRSATQTEERRGFAHEATVFIVHDGTGDYMVLDNVIITPDGVSGIDDYQERLPTPTTRLSSGADFNSIGSKLDPYEFDGDWCVVGFLGGSLDRPFILRYWPHAANSLDAATCGEGNPNSNSEGTSLKQDKRYFKRTNGVETTINSSGDVVVSTRFANSSIVPGTKATEGRFSRAESDAGGSIKISVKPTQSFELDFNEQESGIGVRDQPDEELPQTNPRAVEQNSVVPKNGTYILMDSAEITLTVPQTIYFEAGEHYFVESKDSGELIIADFYSEEIGGDYDHAVGGNSIQAVEGDSSGTVTGNRELTVEGEFICTITGNTTITSAAVLELEGATQVKLGTAASDDEFAIKGDSFMVWLKTLTIPSPFGPLKLDPILVDTLESSSAASQKVVVE